MTKTTIAVLFGGRSCEHEVSILTAHEAMAVLREMPTYEVLPVYITKAGRWLVGEELIRLDRFAHPEDLERRCQPVAIDPGVGLLVADESRLFSARRKALPVDVVLPVLHGPNGEDGTLQGTLEMLGLPYVGSGVFASAACMNKVAMKYLFSAAGLPQVLYAAVNRLQWSASRETAIAAVDALPDGPVFVKPVRGGSSIGVTLAETSPEIESAIELALQYDEEAIIEVAVLGGMEINCSVLKTQDGVQTSVLEAIRADGGLLSYDQKYMQWSKGSASKSIEGHTIPAPIPDDQAKSLKSMACVAFDVCMCDGVARVDFLVRGEEVYVNEVNTMPGSLAFYLWEASGMPFDRLLDLLLRSAIVRGLARQSTVFSLDRNLLADIEARKGAKCQGIG